MYCKINIFALSQERKDKKRGRGRKVHGGKERGG
jgi:hypothetical protein